MSTLTPAKSNGTHAVMHREPRVDSAGSRRTRYAARALVLGVAVTACCGFALALSDRFGVQIDATSTREHQLSARTRRVLNALDRPYELIVAFNGANVDPRAAQRTQDALGAMERASKNLRVSLLDAASGAGGSHLDAVLTRTVERDLPGLERAGRTIAAGGETASSLADELSRLSESLVGAVPTVTAVDATADTLRKYLNESAAFCRLGAQELMDAKSKAESLAKTTIGRTSVPNVEEAANTLRKPLPNLITQLGSLNSSLNDLARSTAASVPEELRSRSRQLGQTLPELRDRVARIQSSIEDLPRIASGTVARALERSAVAIVIGPADAAHGGVTGIDVSALFPPRPPADIATPPPDTRARTEEMLTSAIMALSSTKSPILVLVHGEGVRIGPDYAPLALWAERLKSRGVDLLEWPAALDPEPPSTTTLDPKSERPLVFATISTNASTREGAARMAKLAGAAKSLVESGKRVLISANVSELPSIGQADPMVEFLKPLGLEVDTARPLLQEFSQPKGRVVSADLMLTDPHAEHPISGAIKGLTLRLPWAVPLRAASGPKATIIPIATVDSAGGTIWAESEWTSFRRVPVAQRSTITNPPAPDSSRDDPIGPWTVAAAVERSVSGAPTQRLVVVGCNGWYLDEVAQAQGMVYSQSVLYNPANAELFDAALAWLADEDDAIATSAQARPEALIPNLSDGASAALRWSLIGGLPLLVLLCGATWRLVRG